MTEQVKFEDWFDVNNPVHIRAYLHLRSYGQWPKDFKPIHVKMGPYSEQNILVKMANAHMFRVLETKHKVGDRVSRKVYMDDGTWNNLGDDCLKDSPLKYGRVIAVVPENDKSNALLLYRVKWDNGNTVHYFEHGIDKVKE